MVFRGDTLSVIWKMTVWIECHVCYLLYVKERRSTIGLRCKWKGSNGAEVHLPSIEPGVESPLIHPGYE